MKCFTFHLMEFYDFKIVNLAISEKKIFFCKLQFYEETDVTLLSVAQKLN